MSRDEPMSTDLAFPAADARELVRVALDEDLGPQHRDVTTLATIPADQVATAHVVARAAGVVAGSAAPPDAGTALRQDLVDDDLQAGGAGLDG